MQDVTTLAFMRVMATYGGPEIYWTEYFRVHGDSRPEKWILDSITQNPTGRPTVAQLIGNDIPALVRTAKLLQEYPIAAIDLNLGCPAPVVYRKCAGGGLLRELQKIDAILAALRTAVTIPFTVKTRIGFASPAEFDTLLPLFARHSIDLLTVHGRTVTQMYRPGVRYDLIAQAAPHLEVSRVRQWKHFHGAGGKAITGRNRRARPHDWPRRHPQSMALRANPVRIARGTIPAPHGPSSLAIHSRNLAPGSHNRGEGNRPGTAHEEVYQLHR
jgi:hypothetical protein